MIETPLWDDALRHRLMSELEACRKQDVTDPSAVTERLVEVVAARLHTLLNRNRIQTAALSLTYRRQAEASVNASRAEGGLTNVRRLHRTPEERGALHGTLCSCGLASPCPTRRAVDEACPLPPAGDDMPGQINLMLSQLPRERITPENVTQRVIDSWYTRETLYRVEADALKAEIEELVGTGDAVLRRTVAAERLIGRTGRVLAEVGQFVVTAADDWAATPGLAYAYAVLRGWDCEDHRPDHDDTDCGGSAILPKLGGRWGWSAGWVAHVRALRATLRDVMDRAVQIQAAQDRRGDPPAGAREPAASRERLDD